MPVTSYTLAAPTPANGLVDAASGDFTITLGVGDPGGTVVFTPAATPSTGITFSPTTVSLTNTTRSGTFKVTPTVPAAFSIATTNNGGITDPAAVTYTCIAVDTDAYTVIRNTSGVTKTFSFIGPRGVTLDANELYSIPGGPYDSPYLRYRPRDFDSFTKALKAGKLAIVSSPSLFVKDTATSAVKKVKLTSGTLGTLNPSWGAYTAS